MCNKVDGKRAETEQTKRCVDKMKYKNNLGKTSECRQKTGPICMEQQGINRGRGRKARDGEGVRGGGRSVETWRWAEEEGEG